MSVFQWPVRVYYEDTDAGGVVYHAAYLCFLERARTEWLRHLGLEQDALRREEGILFAVRSLSIDYLRPARFNDELIATVSVAQMGRASFDFDQTIERGETLLCRARVRVACIDADAFRPRAIPQSIRTEMIRDH